MPLVQAIEYYLDENLLKFGASLLTTILLVLAKLASCSIGSEMMPIDSHQIEMFQIIFGHHRKTTTKQVFADVAHWEYHREIEPFLNN